MARLPADIAGMRHQLDNMDAAAETSTPPRSSTRTGSCTRRIAAVSPNVVLRSIYTSLLDLIEAHTLAVLPAGDRPLPEYLQERLRLHTALVDAIATRDSRTALQLIAEHNTPTAHPHPAAANPRSQPSPAAGLSG